MIFSPVFSGGKWYFIWMGFLLFLFFLGLYSYSNQIIDGLIITGMRDQISWGLYVGNFTFLAGIASAAVYLVIPAYLYQFKPVKEIALFAELLAITALILCVLLIIIDLGKPFVFWHLIPIIGNVNFPHSVLVWHFIVIMGYLMINIGAVFYVLYNKYKNKEYKMSVLLPIIVFSLPWAFGIHTVTAFIFNGLNARPYWNTAVIAPKFIASALCAGSSLMIIILQVIRKFYKIKITDEAIDKLAELAIYAIAFHLFLFAAEIFKEYYSDTKHIATIEYLYYGLGEHKKLVFFMRLALLLNILSFVIFLFPQFRKKLKILNIGCLFLFAGVYLEKGIGFVIPGFIPGAMGEIHEYNATLHEYFIVAGIWALGAIIYTFLIKIIMPIYQDKVNIIKNW